MAVHGAFLLVGCSPSEPRACGSSQPLAYTLIGHTPNGGDLKEETRTEDISATPPGSGPEVIVDVEEGRPATIAIPGGCKAGALHSGA